MPVPKEYKMNSKILGAILVMMLGSVSAFADSRETLITCREQGEDGSTLQVGIVEWGGERLGMLVVVNDELLFSGEASGSLEQGFITETYDGPRGGPAHLSLGLDSEKFTESDGELSEPSFDQRYARQLRGLGSRLECEENSVIDWN
jgi:hypothetical protein